VGENEQDGFYEFHERASLLRLLKTVEMLVPVEKETGDEAKTDQEKVGGKGWWSKEK